MQKRTKSLGLCFAAMLGMFATPVNANLSLSVGAIISALFPISKVRIKGRLPQKTFFDLKSAEKAIKKMNVLTYAQEKTPSDTSLVLDYPKLYDATGFKGAGGATGPGYYDLLNPSGLVYVSVPVVVPPIASSDDVAAMLLGTPGNDLNNSVISDDLSKSFEKGDAATLSGGDIDKEYDIEGTHFLRQTELMLQFGAIWGMGDSTLGLGLVVDLGLSFAEFQLKEENSLRISDSFKGKVGVAVEFAPWAQLQFGVGMTRQTVSWTYSKEQKDYTGRIFSLVSKTSDNATAIEAGAKKSNPALDTTKFKKDVDFLDTTQPDFASVSAANFVMNLWARVAFCMYINENYAVTLSLGVDGQPMDSTYSGISLNGKDLTVGGSLRAVVSVGGKYIF